MLDIIFDGPMVHDSDTRFWDLLERSAHDLTRQGPSEDDVEVTAHYLGMMPDESEDEQPRPVDFGYSESWSAQVIDAQIVEAMRLGVYDFGKFTNAMPARFLGTARNPTDYPFDSDGQND